MIISKNLIYSSISGHCPELQNLGVKRIGFFGSASRDEMNQDSDIDFLVEFSEGRKNFDNFMDLSYFLEDLLKNRVELVTPESLSDNLKKHILPEVQYIEIRP
jgi:uncharacterized protein